MRLIGILFTKTRIQYRTGSIPHNCSRYESGHGHLNAAAAEIIAFVSS